MKSRTNLTITVKGVSEGPDGMVHVIDETYDGVKGLVLHAFKGEYNGSSEQEAWAFCLGAFNVMRWANVVSALFHHAGKDRIMMAFGVAMSREKDEGWTVEVSKKVKDE